MYIQASRVSLAHKFDQIKIVQHISPKYAIMNVGSAPKDKIGEVQQLCTSLIML